MSVSSSRTSSRLGVEAITGKPYKPTTQGKNERFHQTLFRWLDKQPLAASLAELQAQVDEFDRIYNTERPHQALPGRVTPRTRVAGDAESRSATTQARTAETAPCHRPRRRSARRRSSMACGCCDCGPTAASDSARSPT